ncbi:hypothetical protein MGH68_01400 [Erysipelothrix sp. D19-032]
MIASLSGGGLRNALTILEQAIVLSMVQLQSNKSMRQTVYCQLMEKWKCLEILRQVICKATY